MTTYTALLRGINVGGHRKIKMADLRHMLTSTGLKNVRTYIQSGNVIFQSDEIDPNVLSNSIKEQVKNIFSHDVTVIIRTPDQLASLIAINPFEARNQDPYMLYVTFFQQEISNKKQKEIESLSNDIESYQFDYGDLFSLIDKQTDKKGLFSNNYIEKMSGVASTTRNWKTVNRIFELSKEK